MNILSFGAYKAFIRIDFYLPIPLPFFNEREFVKHFSSGIRVFIAASVGRSDNCQSVICKGGPYGVWIDRGRNNRVEGERKEEEGIETE